MITSWDKFEDVAELYKEWTEKELTETVQLNAHLVIARDGETIIGAAQLLVIDDPVWGRRWGLVENVYVKEGYRKKGIGSDLMSAIETQAIGLGCKFIKLTSRKKEGKALYRSLGYEEGSSFRMEL